MSPIDQKTRPLKENHLIQRVLHRPVELAGISGMWDSGRNPVSGNPTFRDLGGEKDVFQTSAPPLVPAKTRCAGLMVSASLSLRQIVARGR